MYTGTLDNSILRANSHLMSPQQHKKPTETANRHGPRTNS